jgi:hypothetical protein
MRIIPVALLALATAGCATTPDGMPGVGKRDPDGNPVLARMTPQQWSQAGPQAPVRLTIPTIVRMARQGVSDEEIIRRYYQTGTRLQLTDAQQAELRREGVDQRVIDYILSAAQDAIRIDAITAQADQDARTRMAMEFAYYYGFGWGPGWYAPGWSPRVYPYGGYAWYRGGSGWYGGIGIGF